MIDAFYKQVSNSLASYFHYEISVLNKVRFKIKVIKHSSVNVMVDFIFMMGFVPHVTAMDILSELIRILNSRKEKGRGL